MIPVIHVTRREAELTAALAASQQQIVELKQENELLKQKIDALVRRIFGAGSEKINPDQLELFMAGTGAAPLQPAADAPLPADGAGDALTKIPAGDQPRSYLGRRAPSRRSMPSVSMAKASGVSFNFSAPDSALRGQE